MALKATSFLLMRLKIQDDKNVLRFVAEQDIAGQTYRCEYSVTKMMLVDYLKPSLLVIHIVNQLRRTLSYEAKRYGD